MCTIKSTHYKDPPKIVVTEYEQIKSKDKAGNKTGLY